MLDSDPDPATALAVDDFDCQTVTLTDGITNHTISVEDSEDARLRVQGDAADAEETWRVSDVMLYYRN